MQISPVSYRFNFVNPNSNTFAKGEELQKAQTLPFYPKNYQPYFGARLNRTPVNFYSQTFNEEHMPDTLKKYLTRPDADKEKRPMQSQLEAFEWLPECITIKDVKDMYPDEPLFAELRTLNDIHPKIGYLNELKYKKRVKSTEVLKNGEELTLYLLRKIFLEGKDLKEINDDFKKDAREDLLNEEKYGEKGYFLYSTLHALGISFPDNSYWSSLKATRLDKDYTPTTRTFDPTKERKKRVYTPRPPRILTPEEKQKRSEKMINRWLSLSPVQQANQIEKMRAGLEEKGNVLFDYLSPIMIIATEHIKLSDKLVEFFKKNSGECPTDLSKLTKDQGIKMKKFWDENPQLKAEFSQAIIKTIKVYEKAISFGPQYVEKINSIANAIKVKNEYKATQRRLCSDEAIKAYMRASIMESLGMYYKPYAEKYLSFVLNHRLYKNEFTNFYRQNVLDDMKHRDQYEGSMSKIMNTIHKEFVQKNMRETIAINTAVAEVLYKMTKNPLLFSANNTQLLLSTIVKNHLEGYAASCEGEIAQKVQEYTSGFSDEEIRAIYKLFTDIMECVSKNGYVTLADAKVRNRALNLPKVLKKIEKDKKARNHFKDFLRQYEAQVKLAKRTTTKEGLRFYMVESIIDDYLIKLGF